MKYPTLDEVNTADHIQICKWCRFLPSPGMSAIGTGNDMLFIKILEKEKKILDRILERLKELGGMTPEISKQIGWDKK